MLIGERKLTEAIIGCCFGVHKELGPGFREKIYHRALVKALETGGVAFENEKSYGVSFQGSEVGSFKVDLLVENQVVVEVKAITGRTPKVFEAQLVSYLKASRLPVGLLVNFGNPSCEIKRFIQNGGTFRN